jgi:hypothetical protein
VLGINSSHCLPGCRNFRNHRVYTEIGVLTRLRKGNLLPCGHDKRALRSTYFISSIKLASTAKAASLSACRLRSSLWRGLPDDASAGLPRGKELDSSLGCGCTHVGDCALTVQSAGAPS